ncbi:winged helix DNA-binding domain-containing protein [Kineococcus sp. SYSU DK006]|uniref:winged helix DNA-binding domain-containing protein n=1 Tax=Kineococcus sp. SYSU DK006 TaxID=3383127 RepID=UPI003D7EAE0F
MTRLAAGEVGVWRLAAQGVLPRAGSAAEVVRRLGAVQAQDLRAAATAVALRTAAGGDDLARALEAGEVVRSWPMRGTLHLIGGDDLRRVLRLCAQRTVTASARRRAELGIGDADLAVALRCAQELLTGTRGATRADLLAAFERAGQGTAAGRGYHLLFHLSATGVLCQGPLLGREQAFVLVEEWLPAAGAPGGPERAGDAGGAEDDEDDEDDEDVEEAAARWAARYLRGHGPASAADFAGWTKLPLGRARRAFAAVRGQFEAVEVDGVEHLVDPAVAGLVAAHRRALRGLHLLPGFDEFLLGYAHRGHVLAAEHAARVVPGGNGVFRGTLVSAGTVVGTWVREGDGIAADWFAEPSAAQTAALERRAAALPSGRLG